MERQRRIEIVVATAAGIALIAGAAVVAIVLGTRGEADQAARRGDVGGFITRVVTEVVHNDYAHAWRDLNPEHQRVAPMPEYLACERRDPFTLALNKVQVLSVANRWFAMPGRAQPVRGKEIKLQITLADAATEERAQSTHVFHAVPVGSRWTWVLPQGKYDRYRTDTCP